MIKTRKKMSRQVQAPKAETSDMSRSVVHDLLLEASTSGSEQCILDLLLRNRYHPRTGMSCLWMVAASWGLLLMLGELQLSMNPCRNHAIASARKLRGLCVVGLLQGQCRKLHCRKLHWSFNKIADATSKQATKRSHIMLLLTIQIPLL